MSRPRVSYWNSQPTPYMVERWNAVARRGNIDLRGWFNVEREPDRSWHVDPDSWLFKGSYITPRSIMGRSIYLPLDELQRDKPDMVIQEYASVSMAAGFALSRAAVPRIAFRALPTYDAWVKRSIAKETLKHVLFRAADGAKTGGPDGVRMLAGYGMPEERIFPVTQSIDVAHYGKAKEISSDYRVNARARLGLQGCVFVYVGRLWRKKGLDTLIDAFQALVADGTEASLLLIGDGVDERYYRARCSGLQNVVFTGFVQQHALPFYYALSDVFVFPTLGDPNGLVVEEAMAAGLPVISSRSAGDIELRLPDGRAGFLFEAGNTTRLSELMSRLAVDGDMRTEFSSVARQLARAKSHERYAEDFERFVFETLARPPRRNVIARATGLVGQGAWLASRIGTRSTQSLAKS